MSKLTAARFRAFVERVPVTLNDSTFPVASRFLHNLVRGLVADVRPSSSPTSINARSSSDDRQMKALATLVGVIVFSPFAVAQTPPNVYEAILVEDTPKTTNISTEELRRVLREKTATVFDVRTFEEYAIDHIPGAVNVAGKPGTTREEFTSDVDQIGSIVKGNKAAPMVLYCSGPYCGKSKRVADELVEAGYRNVRRYQLGIPVWRALGEVTEIELEGIQYVLGRDQTAVLIDTRDAEQFRAGTTASARNIPASRVEEVKKAKKDGRLPMEDHNTRIVVFGVDRVHAKAVAEALAKNSFHNVSYYPGTFEQLRAALE